MNKGRPAATHYGQLQGRCGVKNVRNFFSPETHGRPFTPLSQEHLLMLCILVVAILLLFFFRDRLKNKTMRGGLAAFLLIAECSFQIWCVAAGQWSLRTSLPLQISDLAVFLSALMLMTKNHLLFGLLCFAGLGSALQVVLLPDLDYGFPHFRFFQFFASHEGTILACLFMIWVEKFRPHYRRLWQAVCVVTLYGGCIFIFDRAIGANYLYLMRKPPVPGVAWLGPWPWYLLGGWAAMIVLFHLIYLPFWFGKKMRVAGGK
jgi:hypothetical integral membrane protein (TIGR02206 family)